MVKLNVICFSTWFSVSHAFLIIAEKTSDDGYSANVLLMAVIFYQESYVIELYHSF